jgi:hypothetical protein
MKVNQIVNEHKKGVRAKIYNKKATVKAQGSVPLYGPDKQEAKLTPYKPKKIDETEEIKVGPAPANMQQATDPTGKVIATGPADKIAAVAQAAKDGVDFTPNTDDKGAPTPMEEAGEEPMTMTPQDFMSGIQQTASENGMNIGPEEMKQVQQMMVTTPTGEVDMIASMQKMAQAFQSPEFLKMIDDMKNLIATADAAPVVDVQETADNQLLQKMLVIAGLR